MKEWYYSIGGQQVGPLAETELPPLLAQGTIQLSTPVWKQGLSGWIPLQQALPHLAPPATPPAPPLPPAAAAFPVPPPAAPRKKRVGLIILLAILAVLFLLIVGGVAVFVFAGTPFVNAAKHAKALEERQAGLTTLALPVDYLPAEVAGRKLLITSNVSTLGRVDGHYQSASTRLDASSGFSVAVRKFTTAQEAEAKAGSMVRGGVSVQPEKENGGYYFPPTTEDRYGHYTWVSGTNSFEISAPREELEDLQSFVQAYQAASGTAPQE